MADSDERTQGTIKWFNRSKGYGFIGIKDGTDIFLHRSGLRQPEDGSEPEDPEEGERVDFRIEPSAKGPKARDVIVIAD